MAHPKWHYVIDTLAVKVDEARNKAFPIRQRAPNFPKYFRINHLDFRRKSEYKCCNLKEQPSTLFAAILDKIVWDYFS